MTIHTENRHTNMTGSQKTLRKIFMLIPTVVIAVLCYSITAYALLSASVVNTGNVIATTTYNLDIAVTDADGTVIEPANGIYKLTDGAYTVTLTRTTDSASKGYCLVEVDGTTYYTGQITDVNPTYTFTIEEAGDYTFTPVWGVYEGEGTKIDNSSIGGQTDSTDRLDAVQSNDDTASDGSSPAETTPSESDSYTQPADPSVESSTTPSIVK